MHPWFILGVLSFFSFGIQAQECRIASFEKEQILNEWMDKTKESTAYVKLKKDISRLGQSKVKFYEEQLMKFTSGDMCYSTTLMRKVEEYLTFLGEDILCFEDLSIDLLNLFLEDSKKLFLENLNQEILEIQNVYDFNILLRTSDLAYSNIENIQDLTSAYEKDYPLWMFLTLNKYLNN